MKDSQQESHTESQTFQRVRTSTPIAMVDPWIVDRSIEGINRRISRERNHIARCEDLEIVLCKQEKIEKLKAIKKQLRVFKIALVYRSYGLNILAGKMKEMRSGDA